MAIFKGLEERFLERQQELYTKYPAQDGSGQPFLFKLPNDPRRDQRNTSRFFPAQAARNQYDRFLTFGRTGRGKEFYRTETILQTGNTFTETRLINPLFVLSNVNPNTMNLRIRRNILAAKDLILADSAVPSAGYAGRLHKETYNNVLAGITPQSNILRSLIRIIPSNRITRVIGEGLQIYRTVTQIGSNGILGVNERPELNIDGRGGLYSVYLNQSIRPQGLTGIQELRGVVGSIATANPRNAIKLLNSGLRKVRNEVAREVNQLFGGRTVIKVTDQESKLQQYFITSKDSVNGYLDTNNRPITLQGSRIPRFKPVSSLLQKSNNLEKIEAVQSEVLGRKETQQEVDILANALRSQGLGGLIRNQTVSRQDTIAQSLAKWRATTGSIANPMGYLTKNLSRDEDFSQNGSDRVRGTKYGDLFNRGKTFYFGSEESINLKNNGLVDLYFYDYVNSVAVPFRANIAGLTESVIPEFEYTVKYIGRIDRNITYTGAIRKLQFSLVVYALGKSELRTVRQRVQYLTGLCFPSKYSVNNKFMVPPLIKFTLGNLYRNQPAFIESLSNIIEDNYTWDINEQVPMGIRANLSLVLLENSEVRSSSDAFYAYDPERAQSGQVTGASNIPQP